MLNLKKLNEITGILVKYADDMECFIGGGIIDIYLPKGVTVSADDIARLDALGCYREDSASLSDREQFYIFT